MEKNTTKVFPVLETPRLRLRQPKDTDAGSFLAIAQDEEVMRYFGGKELITEGDAVGVLRWLDGLFWQEQGIGWIITERSKDECIGEIGFPAPEYVSNHARAALGFKLAKAFWRQGLMTEALTAVLAYGFETMKLNRIEALVDPRNVACWKLLEKCHLTREGVLRDYQYERGTFINLVMYSLLKREWEKLLLTNEPRRYTKKEEKKSRR